MRPKAAFTLIEVIVVIAIISVLFGTVYAAFGGAREKGRQNVCISNLHQLGTALHLYLQDYDAEDNPKLMAAIPLDHDPALRAYGGDRFKYRCLDLPSARVSTVSYGVGFPSDPVPPDCPSTEWLWSQCSNRMVVFSDAFHNFPDPDLPPSRSQFWILARYDGSVTTGYYNTQVNLNWVNPCFDKPGVSTP